MAKKVRTKKTKKSSNRSAAKNTRVAARKVAAHARKRSKITRQTPTTGSIQQEFHSTLRATEKRVSPMPFPIVGIGASAGGIEAVMELFAALPRDTGMCFVVIQHLDPKHESHLPDIFGRSTSMPVIHADHLMRVEPNHVYVIPTDRSLGIVNGRLRIMPRIEPRPTHRTIDFFFRCLAEDQLSGSVGIVLSGGDGDGTLGLSEIRRRGGVTFAQDPATAKVPSMPQHARSAGVADYCLPIVEIARELVRISRNPLIVNGDQRPLNTSSDETLLERLFQLLRGHSRVDFTHYKRATILRRIKRRMVLRKINVFSEYLAFMEKRPSELQNLFDELLINVTNFFRDPDVFDSLRTKTLPRMLKGRASGTPVRLWVPGCSGGEEVYSLAITLLETFEDLGVRFPIQIFATDISEGSLSRARSGTYPDSIKTDVSPERLRRFFTKVDGSYKILPEVREMCVFASHDVTQDPPYSRIDLISCRNLLIYLGPVLQKRVMRIFAYALNTKGLLVLGSSEAVSFSADFFTQVRKKEKIYSRKPLAFRDGVPVSTLSPPQRFKDELPLVTQSQSRTRGSLENEVQRLMIRKYNPCCVVVGEDLLIQQFYGDTSQYLEHGSGNANLNVVKMAKGSLQGVLRKLLKSPKSHTATGVNVPVNSADGAFRAVIEVYPLDIQHLGRFRVIFFERVQGKATARKTKGEPAGRVSGDTMRGLRLELTQATDTLSESMHDLESANEELQSANEEILSSNEELQSTNEELETAKEELQSSNEELITVNEELSTRNAQLSHVNDDLQNLLASVNLPIVMVGSDLRIRRFTPLSEKLLNLIPGDVGRPITDIKPNFDLHDLRDLISDTIDAMVMKELEVRSNSGQNYLLRIRPYRTGENKIDGAVLVFVDVNRQ